VIITNVDRKNRGINLSIKEREILKESVTTQNIQNDNSTNAGTTNLGALLKAKMNTKNSEQ